MYNDHIVTHYAHLARMMHSIALRVRPTRGFHPALWNSAVILRRMAREG